MNPDNPIAAVTHDDPYPYYATLVAERPFYRDRDLDCWVASSAHAVTAVLASPRCRVRPARARVPAAIAESRAGSLFAQLVRMTDGEGHCPLKRAIAATLELLEGDASSEIVRSVARRIVDEHMRLSSSRAVERVAFRAPVAVLAALLGLDDDSLDETSVLVGDLVRCFGPTATAVQVATGIAAADRLVDFVSRRMRETERQSIATTLAAEIRRFGGAHDLAVANAIGFLTQSYEATAGLILNTLVALGAHSDTLDRIRGGASDVASLVDEVLRFDPPVQNTRRYVDGGEEILGHRVPDGDVILVVLAAANRDPSRNEDPDRFDPGRRTRWHATFGDGVHGCPGARVASRIVVAVVDRLCETGVDIGSLAIPIAYRPSVNTRIPIIAAQMEAE